MQSLYVAIAAALDAAAAARTAIDADALTPEQAAAAECAAELAVLAANAAAIAAERTP